MPNRSVPCLVLLSLLVLARPARTQDPSGETQEWLRRAREAVGAWSAPDAVVEGRGRARASGAEGALVLVLAANGAFRQELSSRLPDGAGFDGQVAWTRDRTGLERVVELEEADRLELVNWVLSGHWLESRRVETSLASGSTPEHPRLRLHLADTPLEMTLELDPATALPAELVQEGDAGLRRWTFEEWRASGGRRLPHRWTYEEEALTDRYEIEAYRPLPAGEASFHPTLAPPRDVHFDGAIEAELEVTRMPSGHLLVEPLLEGEFLGAFVFDTGAGISVIDRKVADELLLETLGTTTAVGVAGSTTTAYRRGATFQLGPVTIENPIYGDLDLGFLQGAFGRKIVGIVGFDLLARCVTELEPGTPRIALFDPEHYTLSGGSWQDLVLHENHACARARFEGEREGLFRLDTGATGTVTFHAPAVAALGLLRGRALAAGLSGGVGGSASSPMGELGWFELAGHRFENPRVSFSQAESGAFTDRYTTGNIGQGFLAPFRLVLDYRHDRLAFVPLAQGR